MDGFMSDRKPSWLCLLIYLFVSNVGIACNDIFNDTTVETVTEVEVCNVKEYVLAQWNIGHYNFGNYPDSRISPVTYDEQVKLYQDMLRGINADLISVSEYSEIFGSNEVGEQKSRNVLFCDYDLAYEGHQDSYACNAIFSNLNLENIRTNAFLNLRTNYYYISADLMLEGHIVKIVGTHLAFNSRNDDYSVTQIKELIEKYQGDEFVIMMGDWNIQDSNNYDLFVDAGYQLANHSKFGVFSTFSKVKAPNASNYALDNIMVKGLYIKNVRVISNDLSDHYPIIATVSFKQQHN